MLNRFVVQILFYSLIPFSAFAFQNISLFTPEVFKFYSEYGKTYYDKLFKKEKERLWGIEVEFVTDFKTKELLRHITTQFPEFQFIPDQWALDDHMKPGQVVYAQPLKRVLCGQHIWWLSENGWAFWSRPNFQLLGPVYLSNHKECVEIASDYEKNWIFWTLDTNSFLNPPSSPLGDPIGPGPQQEFWIRKGHADNCVNYPCPPELSQSQNELWIAKPYFILKQNTKTFEYIALSLGYPNTFNLKCLLSNAKNWIKNTFGTQGEPTVAVSVSHFGSLMLTGVNGVPLIFDLDGSSINDNASTGVELKIGFLAPYEVEDVLAILKVLKTLSSRDLIWAGEHPKVKAAGIHIHVSVPEVKYYDDSSWIPILPRFWWSAFKPYLNEKYPVFENRRKYVEDEGLYQELEKKLSNHTTWEESIKVLERCNGSRYCGVNPLCLNRHGTIEVRWFNTDFDVDLVKTIREQLDTAYAIIGVLRQQANNREVSL